MAKSWLTTHKLAYVLIVTPILGFVLYLETGQPLTTSFGAVIGGFVAYRYGLPFADKLVDSIDAYADKLKKRLGFSKS